MEKITTPIEGLFLIKLKIFHDERGFFTERFNHSEFSKLGFDYNFVQDNHSFSKKNVARGLHAQAGQAKLVGAISGSIYDVAVDIRPNSKTYGKYFAAELSQENGLMLFIPDGFLHGFKVTSEDGANVLYKVTDYYSPLSQFGVNPFDPEISIDWPNKDETIFNQRDLDFKNLKDTDILK